MGIGNAEFDGALTCWGSSLDIKCICGSISNSYPLACLIVVEW